MRQIRFEPSYLDFYEQSVGMPRVKTVTVQNPTTEQSLQLQSISGSTVHFHASFFQSKVVPPLGNTTFDIVFLARLVGNAENTLFIHTSKGVYPYQVFGVGVPNPYRLRPFLGARVPVNFSFTSLINMHNPYSSPLQVVEMYSSGGDLHLELPSGQEEAPQKYWEILPYETKALMKVSFLGRVANNYTAFIRIKATTPAPSNEFLILPVEVEVTAAPGLYSSVDLLDFGTLRTMDEPKNIGLFLLNSGLKQVHISSIAVEPANSAVAINFSPTVLKPGQKHMKVATVTYTAYNAKRSRQWNGKIVIKTNSKTTPRLEVPYQANILQGTIAYSVSKTRFFVSKPPFLPVIRELPITNTFGFTMIIFDAQFPSEVESVFKIVNFTKPVMIAPQKTLTPFYVQFQANGSDVAFSTILRVYTNASIFTVPIHCYDGKVKYYVDSPEEDVLDYGSIGTSQNRTKILRIANNNPVDVTISRITCNVDFASVKLLDVKQNIDNKQRKPGVSQKPASADSADNSKVSIKPGYIASFIVEVCVPTKQGQYLGDVEILTDFETLHVPLFLKAMDGKITAAPSTILFQPSFPGRVESKSLSISSTFSSPLNLVSVVPHPLDARFYFVADSDSGSEILPNKKQKIGSITFNPQLGCKTQCYVGLGTQNKAWLSSLSLPSNVGDIDGQLMDKLRQIYSSYEQSGKRRVNVSFVIDTDVVRGIRVPAQATFTWPSLAPDKPIRFPLTQIGNYSVKTFQLENPSDTEVIIQVVPLSVYPQLQGLLDFMADRLDTDSYGAEEEDHSCFALPKTETPKAGTSSPMRGVLGAEPHVGTNVVILKPHAKVKMPIQFEPKDERMRASVFLIRNNLTVLDAVAVQGQGARGEFTLNGLKPGAHSTILFELKPNHLAECHKSSLRSRLLPSLSVKKTITATNPGQLAIFVSSLSINGYGCEGYGFKVMNCKSFILRPNSSRKIEIAFTPDFSMSRVTRRLQVKSTFGPVMEFNLVATIPPHLLPLCAAAIGRMSWEPGLQVIAGIIMVTILLAILLGAYTEARRLVFITSPEMQMLQLGHEERGKVFDLTTITGMKSNRPAVKENKINTAKQPKKDQKECKETTSQERPVTNGHGVASSASASPFNNNVNKNASSSFPRPPEGAANRSNASSRLSQSSNDSTDKTSKSDQLDARNPAPIKETKCQKNSENRTRNTEPSPNTTAGRKNNDLAATKFDSRSNEGVRNVVSEENCKISNSYELEDEHFSRNESNKKESREKSKSKKKVKASKREEKEKEKKCKDKNIVKQRSRGESDDSGSDSSSEKNFPEIKIQHLTKTDKKPRQVNLPTVVTVNSKSSNTTTANEQQDSNSKNKNRKSQLDVKKAKTEAQPTKPKNSDVVNKKGPAANLSAEAQAERAPTSPHAIATAISLALEKSLQSSCKENSFDEREGSNKKKAYLKATALSSRLNDSPPPTSPSHLSCSSRSSSYSSIVSSDGSSTTPDHTKPKGKTRVINSKSVPLSETPALYPGLSKNQPSVGPIGSRNDRGIPLSGLRRNPWSTSLESAVNPRPVGSQQPKSPTSQFSSMSSSLFGSNPLRRRQPKGERPSLGGGMANSGLGGKTIWEGGTPAPLTSSPKTQQKRFGNPDSLFSFSSQTEEALPGVQARKSNNWVNFLDAASSMGTATSQAGLNKTVSEIWDSGTSPPEGDGWAVYDHSLQSSASDGSSLRYGAEPVDALFKGDSSFLNSGEELPWSQPAPQIWGNGFLGASTATTDTLPVNSAVSGFTGTTGFRSEAQYSSQHPTSNSYDALNGGSIWGPTPWSSANN